MVHELFKMTSPAEVADGLHVVIHDIVMAISNYLHLPREHGYTVEIVNNDNPHIKVVYVKSNEWGLGNMITFGIEFFPQTGLWYPTTNRSYVFLGNTDSLPSGVRGYGFVLRIYDDPVNYKRRWPKGPYPRYTIRREQSKRLMTVNKNA